jgi:hypothetical protein
MLATPRGCGGRRHWKLIQIGSEAAVRDDRDPFGPRSAGPLSLSVAMRAHFPAEVRLPVLAPTFRPHLLVAARRAHLPKSPTTVGLAILPPRTLGRMARASARITCSHGFDPLLESSGTAPRNVDSYFVPNSLPPIAVTCGGCLPADRHPSPARDDSRDARRTTTFRRAVGSCLGLSERRLMHGSRDRILHWRSQLWRRIHLKPARPWIQALTRDKHWHRLYGFSGAKSMAMDRVVERVERSRPPAFRWHRLADMGYSARGICRQFIAANSHHVCPTSIAQLATARRPVNAQTRCRG